MPQTVPYGFEFEPPEEVPGFPPGYTLNGGPSGTLPILAEQVNDEIDRIETDVDGRLTALETAVTAIRWRHITSGSQTGGGSFTLTVPSGYERLRLTMAGNLDGNGNIHLQVNGDGTAGRHRYGRALIDAAGNIEGADYAEDTTWRLAEWATSDSNTMVVEMWPTDGGPPAGAAEVGYQAFGHRSSASASAHRQFFGWGKYQQGVAVTSLVISDVGNNFDTVRWWLEGYVAA